MPLQANHLHRQTCVNLQRPRIRKRLHFFKRLVWVRRRSYKPSLIVTQADDQLIDSILDPAAVWSNHAEQYNLVLDALFDERRKFR